MIYEIPEKLPSLNEYTKACRSNKFAGAKMKSQFEQIIGLYLMKMPRWTKPIKIYFLWIEGNKKRDLDNVCFAKKFILDAMVKYGKLENDNRKHVYAFQDNFAYGKKFKVLIKVKESTEEEMKEFRQMEDNDDLYRRIWSKI